MKQTPLEMLDAYVRAFETMRAEEVVPFYHLPCTFIRPDGVWVVGDEATALVLVNHLIEHAKQQGYVRTSVSGLSMRTLAPVLVELSGVFIRYSESQSEIARFGFTYILRADSNGWKIVVAVAHDAVTETILPSPDEPSAQ
ncbi:MAG: nuclear transport factor 2 family protein [Blastocatellales bacterium]